MRKQFLILAGILALTFLTAAQASAETITVRGRLGRTVEPGGWLVVTDRQKYLILNARRFQNETWFRESTEVEAEGETKPDVITTQMEGIPFEARAMRPLSAPTTTATTGAAGMRMWPTRVSVTGEAKVQAQPDTAIITIAVVTQNASASEAQAENASRSEAVIRAVRAAAGANAEVQTSGYSLQPQYAYKQNESPTITGYTARNSVIVTMSDLQRVGAVIDAATRAGANNIDNLAFTLRKDRPARDQALTDATREAISKAQLIAQALGGRVVRIVEVQESWHVASADSLQTGSPRIDCAGCLDPDRSRRARHHRAGATRRRNRSPTVTADAGRSAVGCRFSLQTGAPPPSSGIRCARRSSLLSASSACAGNLGRSEYNCRRPLEVNRT